MSRYDLSRRAREDLSDIRRYSVSHWGRIRGRAYMERLSKAIGVLANQPGIGRACDELWPGYRQHTVESHVVFYQVVNGRIRIVRVLYAGMDFARHL